MSRWVDFRALKQSMGIEQVLASYRVELKRVGHHQLRGPCPLPTHGSERSRQSFSVDTAKNVWACHSTSCRWRRKRGPVWRVGRDHLCGYAMDFGSAIKGGTRR